MKEKPKTLTPKLRFPEFQDEWRESPLGTVVKEFQQKSTTQDEHEVLTSARGGLMRQVDYFGEGRITERDNVGFNVIPADYLTYRSRTDDGRFYFNHNDLDITGIISIYYPVFHSTDGSNAFLATLLNRFSTAIGTHSVGTSQRVLPISKLLQVRLPIPAAAEQRKIAACLASLDEWIAAEGRKLEVLRAHKKALTRELFPREGESRPSLRFCEFGDAPEWKIRTLGSVCQRIMDGTHFSPKTKSGPRPYLTSKNIRDGWIDLSTVSYISEEEHREIYARCPVSKFDVLLTKDGANTGNCAINTLDFEFSLLSSVAVLRGDASLLDQNFLYQLVASESVQTKIMNSMSGQAITRITLEKLGSYAISLPAIGEQQRIAACLSSLDALAAAQSRKLGSLRAHKKGLMQQLFPSPG